MEEFPYKFHLEVGHENNASITTFHNEVMYWVADQFGDFGSRCSIRGYTVWFRDAVDATAFKLRWS